MAVRAGALVSLFLIFSLPLIAADNVRTDAVAYNDSYINSMSDALKECETIGGVRFRLIVLRDIPAASLETTLQTELAAWQKMNPDHGETGVLVRTAEPGPLSLLLSPAAARQFSTIQLHQINGAVSQTETVNAQCWRLKETLRRIVSGAPPQILFHETVLGHFPKPAAQAIRLTVTLCKWTVEILIGLWVLQNLFFFFWPKREWLWKPNTDWLPVIARAKWALLVLWAVYLVGEWDATARIFNDINRIDIDRRIFPENHGITNGEIVLVLVTFIAAPLGAWLFAWRVFGQRQIKFGWIRTAHLATLFAVPIVFVPENWLMASPAWTTFFSWNLFLLGVVLVFLESVLLFGLLPYEKGEDGRKTWPGVAMVFAVTVPAFIGFIILAGAEALGFSGAISLSRVRLMVLEIHAYMFVFLAGAFYLGATAKKRKTLGELILMNLPFISPPRPRFFSGGSTGGAGVTRSFAKS